MIIITHIHILALVPVSSNTAVNKMAESSTFEGIIFYCNGAVALLPEAAEFPLPYIRLKTNAKLFSKKTLKYSKLRQKRAKGPTRVEFSLLFFLFFFKSTKNDPVIFSFFALLS